MIYLHYCEIEPVGANEREGLKMSKEDDDPSDNITTETSETGFIINNRYQAIKKIWPGSFGIIYLGKDLNIQRYVVIKELHPRLLKDTKFVEMFIDEANILAQFSHPNIVNVHELAMSEDRNRLFIIMEYIEGVSLAKVLSKSRIEKLDIPTELGVYIISETAKALEKCNENNIIHRDLNPTNIMLSTDGQVKLIDFGVAKSSIQRVSGSDSGFMIGKIGFMAPEQVLGKDTVDNRSDIYSLGVVLYEVLSGTPLFQGKNKEQLIKQIAESKIDKKIFDVDESIIPIELKQVILLTTNKDINARNINARAVHDKMEEFLQHRKSKNMHNRLKKFLKDLYSDSDELGRSVEYEGTISGVTEKINTTIPVVRKKEMAPGIMEPETIPGLTSEPEPGILSPDEGQLTVWERVVNAGRKHVRVAKMTSKILGILALAWLISDGIFQYTPVSRRIYDIIKPPALRIETIPVGAKIIIDGEDKGQITRIDRLAPGSHSIICMLDGFSNIEEVIEIHSKGKNILYKKAFSRDITIDSNPQAANIVINNQRINERTPYTIRWEVDRPFELQLVLAGYDRITNFQFDLMNEKPKITNRHVWNFSIRDSTEVKSYAVKGHFYKTVRFASIPSGASIYIDGARSPARRTGENILLTVGEHTIEMQPTRTFRNRNFKGITFTLSVDKGTRNRITREFKRKVNIATIDSAGVGIEADVKMLRILGPPSRRGNEIRFSNQKTPMEWELPYYDTEVVLSKPDYPDTTVYLSRDVNDLMIRMMKEPYQLTDSVEEIEQVEQEEQAEIIEPLIVRPDQERQETEDIKEKKEKEGDKEAKEGEVVEEGEVAVEAGKTKQEEETEEVEKPKVEEETKATEVTKEDEKTKEKEKTKVEKPETGKAYLSETGLETRIVVADKDTWVEIEGVEVAVKQAHREESFVVIGTTDKGGQLKFHILPGLYDFRYTKVGYETEVEKNHEISESKGRDMGPELTKEK